MSSFPISPACAMFVVLCGAGLLTACGGPSVGPPSELEAAAWTGDTDSVKRHIAAGTDLDYQNPTNGSTPLITAAARGNTEVAKLLLDAGADVDAANHDGSTALHTAAFLCRKDIVRALLEHGADTSVRNNTGGTALDSVSGPFEEMKLIYDLFMQVLGPIGLELDYDRIRRERPEIAKMLREA